jgi:hypothetical protein
MKVDKVFINTYKYDFHFARICIASIRYWYPYIPIFLIKDEKEGRFDTSFSEKAWNVNVLDIPRKKFGWGYGKLETLFLSDSFSYLVLDADTVMAGPVLDAVEHINADFIVDEEVQPDKRFNEIYYNLNRINELDPGFVYPGYSFNSGQWFGTTGILKREDFIASLNWTEPPTCRFPEIVFNGDQAHLNFVIHKLEAQKKISVSRANIMVWPSGDNADYIDLSRIKTKATIYPVIIHWAGMGNQISKINRNDILAFFKKYYYSRIGVMKMKFDNVIEQYLRLERKVVCKLKIK